MFYLYLPGAFPAIVYEDERPAYRRHPLLGAFTDPLALVAAYDKARDEAIQRIAATGRSNLPEPLERLAGFDDLGLNISPGCA